MLQSFRKVVALTSLFVIAVACGKTDPISEYGLKTQPKDPNSFEQKPVEPRSPFEFEVTGGTAADFVQGAPGSAALQVRIVDQHVTGYELVGIKLPNGAELKRIDLLNWQINWTPRNILGERQHGYVEVQVQIKVTEATDEIYKRHTLFPHKIRLNVVREGRQPSKSNSALERNYVRPGEAVTFSLDIDDIHSGGNAPSPDPIPSEFTKSKERYCADGSRFIKQQSGSPQKIADGKWRFTFVYDTSDEDVNSLIRARTADETADEIPTCFSIQFKTASNQTTPAYPYQINVRFSPSKAEVSQGKAEVTASRSATSKVNFTVGTSSKRGTLALDTSGNNLETLPNSPKLDCKPNVAAKPTSYACSLTWKLDCASNPPAQLDLRMKAKHTVAGESVETDLVKTIAITKTEKQCPAPKAAAAQKPATSSKPTTPAAKGAKK